MREDQHLNAMRERQCVKGVVNSRTSLMPHMRIRGEKWPRS